MAAPVEFASPEDFIPASDGLVYDEPVSDDGPHCKECGIAIEYGGRGRPPSYCPEHKRTSVRTDKAPKTASDKSGKLAKELNNSLYGIGVLVASADQYDGAVIVSSAPKLSAALAAMAESNPKFKKWLEGGNDSVIWMQLAYAVAGIALPILTHHNVIPGDERQTYERFHGKVAGNPQQDVA